MKKVSSEICPGGLFSITVKLLIQAQSSVTSDQEPPTCNRHVLRYVVSVLWIRSLS